MKEKVAKNIRALRKGFGETQEEAAGKIAIASTALSNYERAIREPDVELLDRIAEHFRVPVSYIESSKGTAIRQRPFSFPQFAQLSATDEKSPFHYSC